MQRSRNFRHRTGSSITLLTLFIVPVLIVATVPASDNSTKTEKSLAPIVFDNALVADNELAKNAANKKPIKEREMVAEAPLDAVLFFYTKPDFTARLLTDYGAAPAFFEQDEEDEKKISEWLLNVQEGGRYRITILGKDKNCALLFFTYFRRAATGIGLKISGSGIIVTRIRQGDDKNSAFFDYDLYLTPGSLPLDEYAGAINLHQILVAKDIRLVVTNFIDLVETAADDPETVADDMAFSEDTFTNKERKAFARHFSLPTP